ncbi:MAG: hypothetical protein ABL888_19725 [Pirellulaceae bacterium]
MTLPNKPEDAKEEFVNAELMTAPSTAEPVAFSPPGLNSFNEPEIISAARVELVSRGLRSLPYRSNFAAVGGAVGSCVLGVWSILGSLFTPFSAINGLIGILLGLWGLRSPRYQLSLLGIILAVIGFFMSILRIPVAAAIEELMNEEAVLFLQSTLLNLHG